jgi:hypothetical protein
VTVTGDGARGVWCAKRPAALPLAPVLIRHPRRCRNPPPTSPSHHRHSLSVQHRFTVHTSRTGTTPPNTFSAKQQIQHFGGQMQCRCSSAALRTWYNAMDLCFGTPINVPQSLGAHQTRLWSGESALQHSSFTEKHATERTHKQMSPAQTREPSEPPLHSSDGGVSASTYVKWLLPP